MCVLPRGKPHVLMESFTDAIPFWQRSVRVGLVRTQQKQHLCKQKNTHTQNCVTILIWGEDKNIVLPF